MTVMVLEGADPLLEKTWHHAVVIGLMHPIDGLDHSNVRIGVDHFPMCHLDPDLVLALWRVHLLVFRGRVLAMGRVRLVVFLVRDIWPPVDVLNWRPGLPAQGRTRVSIT
eukprot:CAMPEP_0115226638 /NCGR_PEP_ID=MMETSP0270-20121206/30735_1 /TAXON_ID=71861 /ORGANISM="Scrippsiella trochoidea, Strain CCMP3099" /LENGTH=109 /DNA_ID=CAMNT_0002641069 /DNA_START=384 /DNA_END=713 /DNA_ORIENTATION=-